jgi:HK97 family phage major capsid protein
MSIQMKAAGDMSPTANFANGSYGNLTTDYRQGVLEHPDNTIYLRNIIPSGTTDAATITYPQANGGEGTPAVWTPGTAKPQFDFDFTAKTVNVQWIAGIVRVPRAMLDDVKFLRSYLQANMLKALLKAENTEILNGDGTGNHLLGLMPQATAYDGDYTVMVEQLVDAAYGQIKDKGFDASNIVMNARDAVGIALNKAAGSGEYDLPPGTVGFVNGRLTIAGLDVVSVGSTQLASGNWLAGDFSAAQLITRLNPEIRFFEQNKDDVEKNMVTIRIEERVALATYFPDAFVKNAVEGGV